MRSFRDDSDYIKMEEFEAGCFRFKINYKELEKRTSSSPFMSPEITSGRVHWHFRYSNARFLFTSLPEDCVVLELRCNTFNFQNNFELCLLGKDGKQFLGVSRGPSTYNDIDDSLFLVVDNLLIEERALIDGWFFVECKAFEALGEETFVGAPLQQDMADSNILMLSPEPAQFGVTDSTIQRENNSSVEVDEGYDDDDDDDFVLDDDDDDDNNIYEESELGDFDFDSYNDLSDAGA